MLNNFFKGVGTITIAIGVLLLYTLASGMSFEDAKAQESRWCAMVESEVWHADENQYRRRCK